MLLTIQASKDHGLVAANAQNKASVADAIDSIQAGSITNLSGGLFMGLTEQVNAANSPVPPSAGPTLHISTFSSLPGAIRLLLLTIAANIGMIRSALFPRFRNLDS